jgi:hypothetical protein
MLRIPIPIALAVLVVAGAATVYFYITVVSNPTQAAWTDQGNGTTYTYTVPAGQWAVLGAYSGSGIYIRSNVTFDIRYDAVSAVAFASDYMPEGEYSIDFYALKVQSGGYISLKHWGKGWCHPGSAVSLPNGMVMYYPDYAAMVADCGCIWPPPSYTIDSNGWLIVEGCATLGTYGQDRVPGYSIEVPVYSRAYGMGSRVYYLYLRPVYVIWVRPSGNAEITVTVSP